MMRFGGIVAAGALIGAGSPASAQVFALNPTTMVGYAGTVAAGQQAARRSFSTRFVAQRRTPAAATATVDPARFAFRPDPAVRQQVYARAIAHARQLSPSDAPEIRRVLLSGSMHRDAANYLARYGMSADNLADTLTLHLAVAWFATRANGGDPSRAQMLSLRRQVAAALASTPEFVRASNATKQEVAEANLIQASLNGTIANAAAKDPRLAPAARQAVARDVMSSYQINLLKLNLTPQGLR